MNQAYGVRHTQGVGVRVRVRDMAKKRGVRILALSGSPKTMGLRLARTHS